MPRHSRILMLAVLPLLLPACSDDTGSVEAQSKIDSCLIGEWRQDSLTQESSTSDGQKAETTGWSGRVLEFRKDGSEVVDFDDADPMVEVSEDDPTSTSTWSGTAVYQVSTSDDSLTFGSVDFSNTTVKLEVDGQTSTYQPKDNPPSPVTYTCNDTTHTQHNDGYDASFSRVT